MIFQKRKLKADYLEKINHSYIEDIDDHTTDDYFKGLIPFEYDSLVKKRKIRKVGKIEKTVIYHVLETTADLAFKKGDLIRFPINRDYIVDEVDLVIPDKFKTLVAMNPSLEERYAVKVVTLYDTR